MRATSHVSVSDKICAILRDMWAPWYVCYTPRYVSSAICELRDCWGWTGALDATQGRRLAPHPTRLHTFVITTTSTNSLASKASSYLAPYFRYYLRFGIFQKISNEEISIKSIILPSPILLSLSPASKAWHATPRPDPNPCSYFCHHLPCGSM